MGEDTRKSRMDTYKIRWYRTKENGDKPESGAEKSKALERLNQAPDKGNGADTDSGLEIAVYTTENWDKVCQIFPQGKALQEHLKHIHFCKAEVWQEYIIGTFYIPTRGTPERGKGFAYIMTKNKLVFVDDTGISAKHMDKIAETKRWKEVSIGRIFYDFLEQMISREASYLEELENEVTVMEAKVFNDDLDNFNHRMTKLARTFTQMYHYYTQLIDLGQELEENEDEFFTESDLRQFRMFHSRVSRLVSTVSQLRDYALQVRTVYQAQMDMHQNHIMKVLTIVTTIFMPLTLVAGWYGMNFKYMPELTGRYSYFIVAAISAVIVLLSVWLLKKKKFW